MPKAMSGRGTTLAPRPVLVRRRTILGWVAGVVIADFLHGGTIARAAGEGVQSESAAYSISIPREPLAVAIRALGHQIGLQIAELSEADAQVGDVGPLNGTMSRVAALERLLAGTGLTWRFVNEQTVVIYRAAGAVIEPGADGSGASAGRNQPFIARIATVFGICTAAEDGKVCAQGAAPETFLDSGTALEEVVVTAERRTEKLIDVPMSVQAFTQQTIDEEGLRNIDDLARMSPGVTLLRYGSGALGNFNDEESDISIRGIESSAGASTTGIYVDDTPIQTRHLNFGTANPYPALFDLDRVEVLKGPQGTLFGSGSEGGTIRFLTPEPSLSGYSGYARTEFGQIDRGGQNYETGLAVGGPLIDGVLGFRASASFRQDGGWVDRVSYDAPPGTVVNTAMGRVTAYAGAPSIRDLLQPNANRHQTAVFRLALKWQPAEGLSIDPSIYQQTLHINDTGAYWVNISDPSHGAYKNGNAQRDPSSDPWYIAALKVSWDIPGIRVISNTSYFSRSQHSTSDYTQWLPSVYGLNQYQYRTDGQVDTALFTDRQENFTQEIRLASVNPKARIQWTAGFWYAHVFENSTEYLISPDLPVLFGVSPAPVPGDVVVSQPEFSALDTQLAAYGDVTLRLNDAFRLDIGLRYSHLGYSGLVYRDPTLLNAFHGVDSYESGSNNPLTPRAVLTYQPAGDALYYLSAAKGFRPGGINAPLPGICTAGLPPLPSTYNSDSLWHYEAGIKDTLISHNLQVATSVYYLQWKSIQQFVYLNCGLGFDDNLGQAEGKGGDIEAHWRATPNLTLGLVAAYTNAVFTRNVVLPGSTLRTVTAGDHLPASPWNLDASVEYVWSGLLQRPYLRLDYQYATAQRSLTPYQDAANAPNDDPTLPGLPVIRVLALRAGVRFRGLDLSAFIQNALDYHEALFTARDVASTAANGYAVNYDTNYFAHGMAPRTYGLTATYRW